MSLGAGPEIMRVEKGREGGEKGGGGGGERVQVRAVE